MAHLAYNDHTTSRILSGKEYTPSSFGTARLNVRTGYGTNDIVKYGFTTDVSASQYCKLAFHVNGKTARIGRTSSRSTSSSSSGNTNATVSGYYSSSQYTTSSTYTGSGTYNNSTNIASSVSTRTSQSTRTSHYTTTMGGSEDPNNTKDTLKDFTYFSTQSTSFKSYGINPTNTFTRNIYQSKSGTVNENLKLTGVSFPISESTITSSHGVNSNTTYSTTVSLNITAYMISTNSQLVKSGAMTSSSTYQTNNTIRTLGSNYLYRTVNSSMYSTTQNTNSTHIYVGTDRFEYTKTASSTNAVNYATASNTTKISVSSTATLTSRTSSTSAGHFPNISYVGPNYTDATTYSISTKSATSSSSSSVSNTNSDIMTNTGTSYRSSTATKSTTGTRIKYSSTSRFTINSRTVFSSTGTGAYPVASFNSILTTTASVRSIRRTTTLNIAQGMVSPVMTNTYGTRSFTQSATKTFYAGHTSIMGHSFASTTLSIWRSATSISYNYTTASGTCYSRPTGTGVINSASETVSTTVPHTLSSFSVTRTYLNTWYSKSWSHTTSTHMSRYTSTSYYTVPGWIYQTRTTTGIQYTTGNYKTNSVTTGFYCNYTSNYYTNAYSYTSGYIAASYQRSSNYSLYTATRYTPLISYRYTFTGSSSISSHNFNL